MAHEGETTCEQVEKQRSDLLDEIQRLKDSNKAMEAELNLARHRGYTLTGARACENPRMHAQPESNGEKPMPRDIFKGRLYIESNGTRGGTILTNEHGEELPCTNIEWKFSAQRGVAEASIDLILTRHKAILIDPVIRVIRVDGDGRSIFPLHDYVRAFPVKDKA